MKYIEAMITRTLAVSPKQAAIIQYLIDAEHYPSKSELIRIAVDFKLNLNRKFKKKLEKKGK